MKCPNCNETLLMMERNHIEIDYCPSCRGVWLDKGELDKMLEYAGGYSAAQPVNQQTDFSNDHHDPYRQHQHGPKRPYKKKGFLGDLFDFD